MSRKLIPADAVGAKAVPRALDHLGRLDAVDGPLHLGIELLHAESWRG
jgi:hypothetical protein